MSEPTQAAPVCLPEMTGCQEICCPHCSAPLEFAWDYEEHREEAKCPQCPYHYIERNDQ